MSNEVDALKEEIQRMRRLACRSCLSAFAYDQASADVAAEPSAPTRSWNHLICIDCSRVMKPTDSEAHRFFADERCCQCGEPKPLGYVMRWDPSQMPCGGEHR